MFRTELPLTPASYQLPLSARVLTIGSCFSDTIGSRLTETKVQTLVNPFGTLFNPVSACKLLRAAVGEDMDWQQHLVEARGRWQSYDLHANFGADSPVELLQMIQQLARDTGVFLATADVVVLTLGTAWVHRLKETDELVSNCHKVPAEKFSKELLTPDEIINAVAETHAYLRLRNPKLRFVLTVSPVRHLKETLPLNAVSKSVLRVACHYLSELLPDVSYFPAYELLLDDLRDYRFYAADMLHPSSVAEDYIWKRFARTYFDVEFGRFRKEWESVRQALNHRPLHPAAPEHREFLTSTLERLEKLARQADMRMEILEVRKQIENLPVPKPAPVPEPKPEDDEERIDIGYEPTPVPVVAAEHTVLIEAINDIVEVEPEEVEEISEAESMAETMEETAQPKKKRRNRGGAKRNKKKHAARLAEEAAALAAGTTILLSEATLVAESETAAESLAAEESSASSAVTVAPNPDAPLQTAMERRKRASRRGKGRGKQLTEAVVEATGIPIELTPSASEANEPFTSEDSNEQPTASLPEPLPAADQSEATEPAVPVVTPGLQRPVRIGRSASEVRAAALRKSRRPDSRIKTLYATPPEPETPSTVVPPTPPAEDAPLSGDAATPAGPVTVAADAQVEPQALASPASTPVQPPVVNPVPPAKGTGASGRLTASGQATLNKKPVRSEPASPPPPAEVEFPTQSVTENSTPEVAALVEDTPASTQANEEVAAAPVAETPVAAPSPDPARAASAPKKPRRRPANAKTKAAAASAAQQAPAKADTSSTPKAKQKGKVTEPPAPAAAPDTPPAPASRRRKPAVKPVATAPEPPVAAPKRAPRPSRRKPAAPDDTPEAS
ncbi:GSCFA domain-containing protein [Hymenobacter sp.]|jgi:hypothetical protein|uniref:GSCFA domain-containing protein n=1 Tax=Hymenobacter sp. TaxID=1898978 RepID=UPI002EDA7581